MTFRADVAPIPGYGLAAAITFLAAASARRARVFASTDFASSAVGTSMLTARSAGRARASDTPSTPPSPGNIRS